MQKVYHTYICKRGRIRGTLPRMNRTNSLGSLLPLDDGLERNLELGGLRYPLGRRRQLACEDALHRFHESAGTEVGDVVGMKLVHHDRLARQLLDRELSGGEIVGTELPERYSDDRPLLAVRVELSVQNARQCERQAAGCDEDIDVRPVPADLLAQIDRIPVTGHNVVTRAFHRLGMRARCELSDLWCERREVAPASEKERDLLRLRPLLCGENDTEFAFEVPLQCLASNAPEDVAVGVRELGEECIRHRNAMHLRHVLGLSRVEDVDPDRPAPRPRNLLVERGRRFPEALNQSAEAMFFARPKAACIGSPHLVGKDLLTALHLHVRENDTLPECVASDGVVHAQCQIGLPRVLVTNRSSIEVFVVAFFGLGRRRVNRPVQSVTVLESRRQLVTTHFARREVGFEPGPREVSAYDEFDRRHRKTPYDHRTHPEIDVTSEVFRKVFIDLSTSRNEMRFHVSLLEELQPEVIHCGEDPSLLGHESVEHEVKDTDGVSRHHQHQVIGQLVAVPNLAPVKELRAGDDRNTSTSRRQESQSNRPFESVSVVFFRSVCAPYFRYLVPRLVQNANSLLVTAPRHHCCGGL